MEEANILSEPEPNVDERIKALGAQLGSLHGKLEIKSLEIDQLQVEAGSRKKKPWWKEPSTWFSVAALCFSIYTACYGLYKDVQLGKSGNRTRAKEIVRRLTDIQSTLATAGPNFPSIQQSTFPEISNLVDEAMSLAVSESTLLRPSEYSMVIAMAFQVGKTERIIPFIEQALASGPEASTEFAIRNYQANYYFFIANDRPKARAILRQVIALAQGQALATDIRTSNVAGEYGLWATMEMNFGDFQRADSLLGVAEDMTITSKEPWRFVGSTATFNIRQTRERLARIDSVKYWRAYLEDKQWSGQNSAKPG